MIRYALATASDDADLRALLRDNPMPSWVSMSLTREPSWFAGADSFGSEWAVIARDGETPVGMCSCSEQPLHLNGAPVRLGYLGALRVAPPFRNRLRVVREGYAAVRSLSPRREPELWYTAIASGNRTARRLLERHLPGMPRYFTAGELVTLALPKSRGRARSLWRPVGPDKLEPLCDFYNQSARRHQFAPHLTPDAARRINAPFYAVERDGEFLACMALWNQQAHRQVVANGYRRPLDLLLPLYNGVARLTRRIELPAVGGPLDQSYLAFLAVSPDWEEGPRLLIEDALALNSSPVLTVGLHGEHPWLPRLMRAFRPATYRSRIYAVAFADSVALDGRPAQPEVALL